MRALIALISLVAYGAQASQLDTRITAVEAASAQHEDVLVRAENNGRVLWANARDARMLQALRSASVSDQNLRISFDESSGVIKGVTALAPSKRDEAQARGRAVDKDDAYQPTMFQSVQQAQAYFNTMDGATKDDSQCYNRAHGWSFDLWNQYRINSLKIFIFFTSRYIREFRYKWWFHTSPMVLASGADRYSSEAVMDRSFTNGPVPVQTWTNIFMKNRVVCPTVRYYTEYSQHQEEQYCFLMKSIMYYRQPRDLELLESQGRYRSDWDYNELRQGRQQAFINWQRYNP